MVEWTSRVTTPKVVLGSRQGLFLPEGHSLLSTLDHLFATFRVQGRITVSLDGPLLYRLELSVLVDTLEGDALMSSLMSDRADSLILGGNWSYCSSGQLDSCQGHSTHDTPSELKTRKSS